MLRVRQATLGEEHVKTLQAMANLAVNLRQAGKLNRAIVLLEKAYDTVKPDSSYYGWIQEELSFSYAQAGEHEKAKQLAEVLFDELQQQAAGDEFKLATMLSSLGSRFLKLQAFAEAELSLRRSLEAIEASRPDSANAYYVKLLLGESLLGQKEFGEAEPYLKSAESGLRRAMEKNPDTFPVSLLDRAVAQLSALHTSWEHPSPESQEKKEQK